MDKEHLIDLISNSIISEIKNILNPLEIVFSTRTVILPSLDSICKSLDQAMTTIGMN